MPKKTIAENEPVVATDGVAAAPAKAKAKTTTRSAATKPRAPRASTKTVTHKHKKTTPASLGVEPVDTPSAPAYEPSHEEVAQRAYSYWEERGYQGGHPDEDWLRAVNELRNR